VLDTFIYGYGDDGIVYTNAMFYMGKLLQHGGKMVSTRSNFPRVYIRRKDQGSVGNMCIMQPSK